MQLEKNLWIEGGYYIDFDEFGQFRIFGPNNHLFCGLIDVPRHKIVITQVASKKSGEELVIDAYFSTKQLNLYYLAMDDVRTFRDIAGKITFLQAREKYVGRLLPHSVKTSKKKTGTEVTFSRRYEENFFYATSFLFSPDVSVKNINSPYKGFQLISKEKNIHFQLRSFTNDIHKSELKHIFINNPSDFDYAVFGKYKNFVRSIWKRTHIEITHLLTWKKTSGDRFGTIFPRDWIESADLGVHDLTPETRSYMYEMALKNISSHGEAWHEDVVGEYKYEYQISGRDIFDRHMIDIEPRIIMGTPSLSSDFFISKENQKKMHLVASYIIQNAKKHPYITFKKRSENSDRASEYHQSGNWRDSSSAFRLIDPIIAPFDVNAVFYPLALRVIEQYKKVLGISVRGLSVLIKKWDGKLKEYRFKTKDNFLAYALALYGMHPKKGKVVAQKLCVDHLDEAYLYTYCESSPKDVESFCKRLLSQKHFFTASGPLIVSRMSSFGYTSAEYHGLVIWMKQTAFTVLGLSKHLKIAITNHWPLGIQKLIYKTIVTLAETTLYTCDTLHAVPELHYDDHGIPHFFSDHPHVSGEMSKVQLWSAVGVRRIIRKYYELLTDDGYSHLR